MSRTRHQRPARRLPPADHALLVVVIVVLARTPDPAHLLATATLLAARLAPLLRTP
ncbi:hypothetical protein Kpho02_26700 [Kitasatospora phosalacinea]|uniref:Uncharacterized protein n=1 Tax=Kitasatospora phosalacinea TaxID=2065 RepID=A0A9W6Q8E2_9ACTN|nr:hypothetical protein [Kitasatospora phosalacinea]GLW70371.1 hypothetical protein Kpho02_26700 [Kitasatospora phosalacinea]